MIKFFVKMTAACIFWFCVVCALTPSILSTTGGRDFIFYLIKRATSYQIEAETVRLSWMGSQKISGINLQDPQKGVAFQVHQIETTSSLWKIIFYRDIGTLRIQAPSLSFKPGCDLPKQLTSYEMGFRLPFTFKPTFQPLGEIEVVGGKVSYVLSAGHVITAQDISLSALLLPHQFKAQIEGRMHPEEGIFQLQLFSYPKISQFDLTGKIEKLPLSRLSSLNSLLNIEGQPILKEGVTDDYLVEMKAKYYGQRLDLELNANSSHTLLSLKGTLLDKVFSLTSPALIHYHIPASFVKAWTGVDIQSPLEGEMTLNHLVMPLLEMERLSLQGVIKSQPIGWKEWMFDPFSLYLGKDEADLAEWKIKVDSSQVQFNGKVILQDTFQDLVFQGQALLPKNTRVDMTCDTLKQMHLMADGDLVTLDLTASLDLDTHTFALLKEGVIDLHGLKSIPGFAEKFTECAPVHVDIEPFHLNFKHPSGQMGAIVKNKNFICDRFIGGETAIQLHLDLYRKSLTLLGKSELNQHPYPFQAELSWLRGIEFQSSCEQAPLDFFHTLFRSQPSLRSLTGDELSYHLKGQLIGDESLAQLKITTPSLAMTADLIGDQRFMRLKEPATLHLHLTPSEEKPLAFLGDHELISPLTLKVEVDKLTLPLKRQKIKEWIKQLDYQAYAQVFDDITFQRNALIQDLPAFRLDVNQHSSAHQLNLTAVMHERAREEPSLMCQMNSGSMQDIKASFQCQKFPTSLLELARNGLHQIPFHALLGPTLDLTLNTCLTDLTGPCQLTLKAPVSQVEVSGFFHQGVLNLKESLYLQTQLSQELSEWLMQKSNVLGSFSCFSEGPIQIEIAPQGFSMPSFPVDLSQTRIKQGVCELGRMQWNLCPPLNTVLSLLRAKRPRLNKTVPLWLAPIEWSFHEGSLVVPRMDVLLAEEFPLCFTGMCDLTHQTVQGTIGLTAECLQKSFQISQLPLGYILPIPLTGTVQAVEIHPKQAMKSIGQLMLWKQGKKFSKTQKGYAEEIVDEFLDRGTSLETSEIFPPLKEPLPWELTEIKEHENLEKQEARKLEQIHVNPKDPALHQALKYFH